MVEITLNKKMHDAQSVVGLIAKMPFPAGVELAGHLGYDLVIIDTEHGLGGGADLENHLRAADSAKIPVLVRLSKIDRAEIARALDAGAVGVVIPQVESAADARTVVSLSHYPPVGVRGLATSTRAGKQGTIATASHLADAAERTTVVVQIESAEGVRNADDILQVKGVNAVWIGLSDLTLDLGKFGQLDDPTVADAVTTVVDACARHNVPLCVIADNPEDGVRWRSRGATVLLINLLSVLSQGMKSLASSHAALS